MYTLQLPNKTCFCAFSSIEEAEVYKDKWYARTNIDVEVIPMPANVAGIVCPVIE